jgi:HlyD family secretion protein
VLTIIVGTYVSGVIQELYCDYNTKVKQGQVCAKIDPRPYQAIVDQDRASLATARAQLEKDSAVVTNATLSFQRAVNLQRTGVVTQAELDSATSARDQAVAQVGVDQATIEERQAELDAAQVNLGYTNIVSPVNGTVVSRNVTMGQTVAASLQTPTLFLIATDLTNMEVDDNISESDIGGIKVGNPATFTVEAYPNRLFSGAVRQVRQSPQTVQNVVTYDVVVAVANTDLALMPGMTATIRIVTSQRDSVLRVPDQALRYTPGGLAGAATSLPTQGGAASSTHVWVLRDGRPVRVAITPGLDDDAFTEVMRGDLQEGDQLIVSERSGAAGKSGPSVAPPRAF